MRISDWSSDVCSSDLKALPAPLYAYGGFIPFGPASIFSGVTAVIPALVGAEIITIAAADAHEPGSVIARLTTTLIIRVALFYLLSMLMIVAIGPWTDIRPGHSPFALALRGELGRATCRERVWQ